MITIDKIILAAVLALFVASAGLSITFVVGASLAIIFLFGLWVGAYLMPKRPDVQAQIKQLEASNNELIEKVGTLERDLLAYRLSKK